MTMRNDLLVIADLLEAVLDDHEHAQRPSAWSQLWGRVREPDRVAQLLTETLAGLLAARGEGEGLTAKQTVLDFRTAAELAPE